MLYLISVLLAVILLYTRNDWTLKPVTPLQWYLLFTVAFYFYRWTFQWGTPETTVYEGDAPGWVRIIKDLVFIGFVLLWAAKARFKYSTLIWYVGPFVAWLALCSFIRLFTANDSHNVLFLLRTSIEYIPLAFVVFEEDVDRLLKFATGCCWIVVGFLALEMFSGRVSGFVKDDVFYSRYGSIFGSPNELGIFTALALLGVLVFSDRIARRTRILLIPLLSLTMLLTGSRSSIVGLVAGLISIWPKSKRWLLVIAAIGGLAYLSLLTVFHDTAVVDSLVSRIGDASAATRLDEFEQVKSAVNDWNIPRMIFGNSQQTHQENYYFSVLLRSGFPGVLLFGFLVSCTLIRSRHLFLRAGIVSMLVASLFVPYLDVFPPHVYFWLMVGAVWSLPECRSAVLRQGVSKGSAITAWTPRLRT